MRRPFLFLLLPALIFFVSCEDDTYDAQNRVAEELEGNYYLSAVLWTGSPVDIDNDGITTNDLLPEYLNLELCKERAKNFGAFTDFVLEEDSYRTGLVYMTLPLQSIHRFGYSDEPVVWQGDSLPLHLDYSISLDGTLTFEHFESLNMSRNNNIEKAEIADGTMVLVSEGVLEFTVGISLYDWNQKKLIHAPATYKFVRK